VEGSCRWLLRNLLRAMLVGRPAKFEGQGEEVKGNRYFPFPLVPFPQGLQEPDLSLVPWLVNGFKYFQFSSLQRLALRAED
jgi:hypothetical protein